jgi:hypothetical protein
MSVKLYVKGSLYLYTKNDLNAAISSYIKMPPKNDFKNDVLGQNYSGNFLKNNFFLYNSIIV